MLYRIWLETPGHDGVVIARALTVPWPTVDLRMVATSAAPTLGERRYQDARTRAVLTVGGNARARLLGGSTEYALILSPLGGAILVAGVIAWGVALHLAGNGVPAWLGVVVLATVARLAVALMTGVGLVRRDPVPALAFGGVLLGVGLAFAQAYIGEDVLAWRVALAVLSWPALVYATVAGVWAGTFLPEGYDHVGVFGGGTLVLLLAGVGGALLWR